MWHLDQLHIYTLKGVYNLPNIVEIEEQEDNRYEVKHPGSRNTPRVKIQSSSQKLPRTRSKPSKAWQEMVFRGRRHQDNEEKKT